MGIPSKSSETIFQGRLPFECTSKVANNICYSDLLFSVQKLIAYCSQGTTLEAGSIILTGTPAGVGFTRNPKIFLENGSEVRICVEKIGTLVNQVYYEA